MFNHPIPVYVINLKHRTERKEYILQEFKNKKEFDVQIIEACSHDIGPIGLWNSIKKVITIAQDSSADFIVVCEDDHQFTDDYSAEKLFNAIADAKKLNADVLSGGVSWFTGTIQCTEHVYWMEMFSGTQFLMIFRNFFETMLNARFNAGDDADYKICSLTDRRFFICPFISVQKEFGYSDATAKNNVEGRVEALFKKSCTTIDAIKDISEFYHNTLSLKEEVDLCEIGSYRIPTYIINLPERTERRKHIEEQFKGKNEFDFTLIQACRHEVGAVGLWLSIRKVIEAAIVNDDDVIIICEDDHEFTENYSKEILIKNIIEAHGQHVDYMSGGSGKFGLALPVSENRVWTNFCFSTQFIIIFKKFFQSILNEPFDDSVIGDKKLSEMTVNKMLFCPFISQQKDFGYSDVTPMHNENAGMLNFLFAKSTHRINQIHNAYVMLFKK